MFSLKRISPEAVPAALDRAERYRLLNEPLEAESICRDILEVDPENRAAIVTLILALTDELDNRGTAATDEALRLPAHLPDEYGRLYFEGMIHERIAKFRLRNREAPSAIYHYLRRAMQLFEAAEKLRPEGNDEALLRWNTCVRILNRHPRIVGEAMEEERREKIAAEESAEMMLE